MSELKPRISIVIPVYNEEKIVESSIANLILNLSRDFPYEYSIVLCENGSRDSTLEKINRVEQRYPQVSHLSISEANYGKALKTGILSSEAEYIICDEIDICSVDFYQRSLNILMNGEADMVVGSKRLKSSSDQRPLFRRIATAGVNYLLRILFGFRGTDTHGLKAMRRAVLRPIAQECIIEKDVFASELVIRAERKGVKIKEIPIAIKEKRHTPIALIKRVPTVLKNLARLFVAIRLNKKELAGVFNSVRHSVIFHRLAIGCAVAVGLLSIAPYLLSTFALGSDFKGIPLLFSDEDLYQARIQEIVDGHGAVASPYVYEYKNQEPLQLPVAEYLYALPSLIFNVDVSRVVQWYKFIFPTLLFLVIYLFVCKLSLEGGGESGKAKLNAVAAGLFSTVGYDLIDFRYVWSVVSGQHQGAILSIWTRPVNPVTGAIFLFIFLLIVWRVLKQRRRCTFLPAGILLAMMSGYFFSWMLALSILGVLLIIFLYKKDYFIIKQLLLAVVVNIVIIGYHAYQVTKLLSSPQGGHLAAINGLFITHAPLLNKFLLATIIVFFIISLLYFLRRPNKLEVNQNIWWLLSVAILLGGLIAMNQQVITGKAIWPYHFIQYIIPLAIAVLFVAFFNLVSPLYPRLWIVVAMVGTVASLSFSLFSISHYRYSLPEMRATQKYSTLFSWINQNTATDCVVMVGERELNLTRLIPAFTHCNTYISALSFGLPLERMYHNFLVFLRLQNIKPEEFQKAINDYTDDIRNQIFGGWRQFSKLSPTNDAVIEEAKELLVARYTDFVKRDFDSELKRYRIDYVILSQQDGQNKENWRFLKREVLNQNGIAVYQID